jgi:hypothetical protein
MTGPWSTTRLAPFVAGAGGLLFFWLELAPVRAGFEDTDAPALGLRFLAANPGAWTLTGLVLAIAALALVATVIGMRDRLEAGGRPDERDQGVAVRTVSVIGLFAALFFLGHAATRLAAGPILYVRGLDQTWGEMAYVVSNFVGTQLFAVGGAALLAIWIAGVAWIGVRRGVLPRALAILAVVPTLRIIAIPGLGDILPGAWFLLVLAIPGAFVWLVLLGAWPRPAHAADRAAPATRRPRPSEASL